MQRGKNNCKMASGSKRVKCREEALELYRLIKFQSQQFLATDPKVMGHFFWNKSLQVDSQTQTEPVSPSCDKSIQTEGKKTSNFLVQVDGDFIDEDLKKLRWSKVKVERGEEFNNDLFDLYNVDAAVEEEEDADAEPVRSTGSSFTATPKEDGDRREQKYVKCFSEELRQKLEQLKGFQVKVEREQRSTQNLKVEDEVKLENKEDILLQKRLHEMRRAKSEVEVKGEIELKSGKGKGQGVKYGAAFGAKLEELMEEEEKVCKELSGDDQASRVPLKGTRSKRQNKGRKVKVQFGDLPVTKGKKCIEENKNGDSKVKVELKAKVKQIQNTCSEDGISLRTRASQKLLVRAEKKKVEVDQPIIEKKPRVNRVKGEKCEIICSECGKVFQNASSLRQHAAFHRPERPFKCDAANGKCGKSYKTVSELNRHKVAHGGKKEFVCSICNKQFLRKTYLKGHLSRHPQATLYPCSQANCNKVYITKTELDCHFLTYHRRNAARRKASATETQLFKVSA